MPPQGTLISPQWAPGWGSRLSWDTKAVLLLLWLRTSARSAGLSQVLEMMQSHIISAKPQEQGKRQVSGHQVSRCTSRTVRKSAGKELSRQVMTSQGSVLPCMAQWDTGSCRRCCPSCRDRADTASIKGSTHGAISAQPKLLPASSFLLLAAGKAKTLKTRLRSHQTPQDFWAPLLPALGSTAAHSTSK